MFGCCLMCLGTIKACDVCGSSASNIGIGLLTDYRGNFVRATYFNTQFNSNSEHEYLVSDVFTRYDLSIRYSLGKSGRIKPMLTLPYGRNIRDIEEEQIIESGLSDIRLTTNYAILNHLEIDDELFIYWEAGGGISLPTGKFDDDILDRDLPENFNLGRGSLAYIFQSNTVLTYQNIGLVISNAFQWNDKTKTNYRFGHQYNLQSSFFWELDLREFKLIPNLGVAMERISPDNFANGREVSGTGGKGVFLSSGLNLRTKRWLAGFSYSTPMTEEYSDGEVNSKGRIISSVTFIF